MLRAQPERSVITFGIVLSLAGLLTVANGLGAAHHARRFQANAIHATATVVGAQNPRGALRFQTAQGIVETPLPRGRHRAVGTQLKILYEPHDPERWTMEPGYDPSYGVALAWGGVAMLMGGATLLIVGWISRRRNQRPFWE